VQAVPGGNILAVVLGTLSPTVRLHPPRSTSQGRGRVHYGQTVRGGGDGGEDEERAVRYWQTVREEEEESEGEGEAEGGGEYSRHSPPHSLDQHSPRREEGGYTMGKQSAVTVTFLHTFILERRTEGRGDLAGGEIKP